MNAIKSIPLKECIDGRCLVLCVQHGSALDKFINELYPWEEIIGSGFCAFCKEASAGEIPPPCCSYYVQGPDDLPREIAYFNCS